MPTDCYSSGENRSINAGTATLQVNLENFRFLAPQGPKNSKILDFGASNMEFTLRPIDWFLFRSNRFSSFRDLRGGRLSPPPDTFIDFFSPTLIGLRSRLSVSNWAVSMLSGFMALGQVAENDLASFGDHASIVVPLAMQPSS